MRLIFLSLILLILLIQSADAKKKSRSKFPSSKHQPLRAAKKHDATGPCKSDGSCVDPADVCQKSDNECYPKGTAGLDDDDDDNGKGKKGDDDDDDNKGKKGDDDDDNGKENDDEDKKKKNCKNLNAPGKPSDCPKMKAYCNNQVYYQLMTEQCPVTCGRGCAKKN